jgi:hypothetical protein
MKELMVDDVMQIDFHAPGADQVGSALRPETSYLPSVWDECSKVFKTKRVPQTKVKVPRHKGQHRDAEEIASKRRRRGAAKPEAEVIREREKEVQKVMASSAEERKAMASKSFHGAPVPPDSGKCVTAETEKARQQIKKQWESAGSGRDPASSNGLLKRQSGGHDWGSSKKRKIPPPWTLLQPGESVAGLRGQSPKLLHEDTRGKDAKQSRQSPRLVLEDARGKDAEGSRQGPTLLPKDAKGKDERGSRQGPKHVLKDAKGKDEEGSRRRPKESSAVVRRHSPKESSAVVLQESAYFLNACRAKGNPFPSSGFSSMYYPYTCAICNKDSSVDCKCPSV